MHGRLLVALQAFVVAARFVVFVAEVFHRFIVDEGVDRARVGLRIELVHRAPEMRAPLGDDDRERDVGGQRAERDQGERFVVVQRQVAQHQADLDQRRQDREHRVRDQRADAARAALDVARHAAGLAVQVKPQRQRVQVAEHLQRDRAHGALRDAREQEFAQLRKQRRRKAQQAVGDQGAERQHHQRIRIRRVDAEVVDDLLERQRHAQVGDLGQDQARQRGRHAPFVDPQVGQQRADGRPVVARRTGHRGGRRCSGRRASHDKNVGTI